ncbi:GNAT family N-acetyltransferase [Microbacterium sp. A93]|uniref:GNAT family N-acetyltransferase n=1 Tax=Microbacterium sp. A93 TaxID=3450716 RepID=UPI003F427615
MPSFHNPVLIVTPGVRLTSLASSDADALVECFRDSEVRRWLPLPDPYTKEIAEDWCTHTSEELRASGRGLVVAIRSDTDLLGSLDAKRVDWRAQTLELSYWTAPAHRGQGIMTAAVRTLATWLLSTLEFQRIELRISPENTASQRVAERAGFTREGTARNAGFTDAGRTDLVIHSLVPQDLW